MCTVLPAVGSLESMQIYVSLRLPDQVTGATASLRAQIELCFGSVLTLSDQLDALCVCCCLIFFVCSYPKRSNKVRWQNWRIMLDLQYKNKIRKNLFDTSQPTVCSTCFAYHPVNAAKDTRILHTLHSSWMLPISLDTMGQIHRKISSLPHWHLHADRRSDGQVLVDQALVWEICCTMSTLILLVQFSPNSEF